MERNSEKRKTCNHCKRSRPLSDFHKCRTEPDGLQRRCFSCSSMASKKWRLRNYAEILAREKKRREDDPERFSKYRMNSVASGTRSRCSRIRHLHKKYGLTQSRYDQILKSQNGVCAICRGQPNGRFKRLQVDHCHSTGTVRGLLCWKCNVVLGKVSDDPEILTRMIDYLSKSLKDSKKGKRKCSTQ